MITLLTRGGPVAQLVFLLGVLGPPVLVLTLGLWRRRQDLTRPALEAAASARTRGESPARQYEVGRNAALKAARPSSAGVLETLLIGWVGLIMALGLVSFLATPGPAVVADVLRGRLELASGQAAAGFVDGVIRNLIAGSQASLLALPGLLVVGVGLGFLRTGLLGSALDRALVSLIGDVDPRGELPELRAIASGIPVAARHRWSAAGFLLGPLWLIYRQRWGQAFKVLAAMLGLSLLGLGVWYLGARLLWAGDPLNSGSAAGALWFHLRDAISFLFVLPTLVYTAVRG